MKNLSLIAFLFLILFSACKKDEPIIDTPTNATVSPIDDWVPVIENINGSLVGQVNDESGTPINNASVTLNNETTTTNAYGFFFFDDVTMNSKGSYVKVEKNGYFLGSRRFFPQSDVRSNVKITLLQKAFNQSFSSDTESVMAFEGASVSFAANSIANENGEAYTGNVNFSAKWLDPSSPEVYLEMPGNLQGVNTESDEVVLKTLGMIAVELEDDAGNELNILEGATATISVPVPQELLANAPAEIPLWSFDEEHGMWAEEGKASLQNGSYVGEVSHFSFWNCDIPADYVYLSLSVQFENGAPFSNGYVILSSEIFGEAYGSPDASGGMSGIIPANEVLTLSIYDYLCSELIFEQEIGSFSENTDLGAITIQNPNIAVTTISGTLIDCEDNPISPGILRISFSEESFYYPILNADFTYTYTTCQPLGSVSVIGIDLENSVESTPVNIIEGEDNNIGNLSACGVENELDYLQLTIDGVSKSYVVSEVTQIDNDSTHFYVSIEDLYIDISFAGITAGSYGDVGNSKFIIYDIPAQWAFNYNYSNTSDENYFSTFEVVETNGKLSGTMSGELYNSDFNSNQFQQVEGEFLITPPE